MKENHSGQPLEGVRILDVATLIAAPLSTTLLADFGADVIKIESPGEGDSIRNYPPLHEGESLHWRVGGRNKRSLTVDLRTAEGQQIVRKLAAQSDVLVTNFRQPTLVRWQLDYDDLQADNPGLVYMHLTGFGRTGPWSDRPGFARVAEAFAGLTAITGSPDEAPVFPGYPIGDALAGVYGAMSLLLALEHRRRTGRGQLVDLGLYEPMLRILEDLYSSADLSGTSKVRQGNAQHHSCPNGLFPSRDGRWVVLPVSTDNMWHRLLFVMGDDDMRRFTTMQDRVANRDFVESRVAAFTASHDLDDLLEKFQRAGVACGKVNSAVDVITNEQVAARENFVRIYDEVLGRDVLVQAPCPQLSDSPGSIRLPAPLVGEHTETILRDALGMAEEDVNRLRKEGIV